MSSKNKLTREQRKEIKAVVKKYWQPKKTDVTEQGGALIFGSLSAANLSFLAIDIMTTGGLASIAYYTLWTGYAGGLSIKHAKRHFASEFNNAAGQKIIAPEAVKKAFDGMEGELKVLFNRRASSTKGTEHHRNVQKKINEVYKDLRTLRPVYEVQERGEYQGWASKYVFLDTFAKDDQGINGPHERREPIRKLGK